MDEQNILQLPSEIRIKLAELEVELSEGDITEKGYQKKKSKLLAPYVRGQGSGVTASTHNSISVQNTFGITLPPSLRNGDSHYNQATDHTETNIGHIPVCSSIRELNESSPPLTTQNRRSVHESHRYRSDIREEAVKEALVQTFGSHHEALAPNKRRQNSRLPHLKQSSGQTKHGSDNSEEEISSSESSAHAVPSSSHAPISNSKRPLTSHMLNFQHPSSLSGELNNSSCLNSVHASPQVAPKCNRSVELCEDQNGKFKADTLSSIDSLDQLATQAEAQLATGNVVTPYDQLLPTNSQSSVDHPPVPQLPHMSHSSPFVSPHITQKSNIFGGVKVMLEPLSTIPNGHDRLVSTPFIKDGLHNDGVRVLAAKSTSLNPYTADITRERKSSITTNLSDVPSAKGPLVCHNRVSEKIQQLVNTLKRPKRHPLPEYFLDDEDQILVRPVQDPSAPRPRGPQSQAILGDELVVPSGLPRNLESALQRYAGLSCKTPALTCLDGSGKPSQVLTYAKLLQRSIRIAYTLLNKLGHRGEQSLKPRDRVALVYANNEPVSFLAAFYGCILASVIPIAIEVPSPRRDMSYQSMGFLLNSLDTRVILASEQCYKAFQRNPNSGAGNADAHTSNWPHLTWIDTDNFAGSNKPPKDWTLPDRLANDDTMYMEYTFNKDGSVHAVTITRRATLAHCRSLTAACHYSEEDVVVCVVDCRRQVGLWHAVLTSVFNGLHVIFVPYSVMQVDPGSWLRMVTKYRATVALVKSRDMHWALLAERDHPNVNLSSLRMLLVADGSNPWSLNSCDSFVQKFHTRGFASEAICPAAGSPETLTLCLRIPPQSSSTPRNNAADDKLYGESTISPTPNTVRGVISIHSLTYGVVRVDSEDSLTSLTLQDCGQVLPGATAVVVRFGPKPVLCRTDEIGEICLCSDYTGSGYWGLPGQTDAFFHVEPINEDGSLVGTKKYTRSGFIGFPGPTSSSKQGGLIFICGSIDGLMNIGGRKHNADDIIATVLAVQPTKIVYRGRIAVFSVELLKDERLVIVAELRQGYTDEAAFTWMSLVLQAVDSIHQVSVYCIALVHQNVLPKTPFGGINYHSIKRLFSEGQLHPTALLLCPHSAIQNLPQPRQHRPSLVGPSAMMVGQVVQGVRLAEARGRPIPISVAPQGSPDNNNGFQLITDLLTWRASHTPDDRLFTVYNAKGQESSTLTCIQLLRRSERLAAQLQDKGKVSSGTVVALLYPPGTELVCAFYACLLIGAIPVPVRPPRNESSHTPLVNSSNSSGLLSSGSITGLNLLGLGGSTSSPPTVIPVSHSLNSNMPVTSSGISPFFATGSGSFPNVYSRSNSPTMESSLQLMWNVIKHSGATVIFSQSNIIKLLKSKEASSHIPFGHWPLILDSEDNYRKKRNVQNVQAQEQSVAYLDFAASTTGTLTGIRVTHRIIHALCRAQKVQCELYPTREVVLNLDPYSGLGFTLWVLTSVYCGHHTILIPPHVTEVIPDLWLTVCSQRKVRDTFCSYFTLELATRYLAKQMSILRQRDISLSSLRSLVVVAEERPRVQLTLVFTKLFASLGLMSRAVSTSFGCRVNLAISLQGASSPENTTVYVDRVSLRNDRVKLLEKGSPHSLCLMESGKLLPGVHVVIANPDTFGQCADSQLGEIWVSSPHNSTELLGPFDSASLNRAQTDVSQPVPGSHVADSLRARLVTGDTERVYARTGFLGFVRRTDLTQSDGELHDAIFVVGSLEEAILLRGMRYHPIDIENTVMRAHRKICECAVFTWSNLLVVVTELAGEEHEAMDLVHSITANVLTEHQLIVGVVVVVDPATVPVNSSGEKQRILLRDCFVNDKLDPIYVSYNM